jgi:hypothetical protein
MGVFHDMVEVVNRTSKPLTVLFDGQRETLEPNYDDKGKRIADVHNMIPRHVVPYALNQNVLLGSESFTNPSDFRSLVGVVDKKATRKHSWHDCSYLEQSDELTRVPMAAIMDEDPTITGFKVKGKKQHASDDLGANMPTVFDLQSK